jgi:hypothetical protein
MHGVWAAYGEEREDFPDFTPKTGCDGKMRHSPFGVKWTRLAKTGQNWPKMDTAGQIWTTVAKSGQPVDKIFPSLVRTKPTPRSVRPKFFPCFCRVLSVLGGLVVYRARGDTTEKMAWMRPFVQKHGDPIHGVVQFAGRLGDTVGNAVLVASHVGTGYRKAAWPITIKERKHVDLS